MYVVERAHQLTGPIRSSPRAAYSETPAADQLAATMRLVKAARFNAAERLESKQAASLFTQSMVALYFVGLAVWQAVYTGQIDDASGRLMTFIQLVSSVFTLMLGLLEAMNDYKMKAHHLHNCALAVSELAQELKIARPSDPHVVQEFRRRYSDALKSLPREPYAPRLSLTPSSTERRTGPPGSPSGRDTCSTSTGSTRCSSPSPRCCGGCTGRPRASTSSKHIAPTPSISRPATTWDVRFSCLVHLESAASACHVQSSARPAWQRTVGFGECGAAGPRSAAATASRDTRRPAASLPSIKLGLPQSRFGRGDHEARVMPASLTSIEAVVVIGAGAAAVGYLAYSLIDGNTSHALAGFGRVCGRVGLRPDASELHVSAANARCSPSRLSSPSRSPMAKPCCHGRAGSHEPLAPTVPIPGLTVIPAEAGICPDSIWESNRA